MLLAEPSTRRSTLRGISGEANRTRVRAEAIARLDEDLRNVNDDINAAREARRGACDEREGWLAATGLAPDAISSDVTTLGLVGTHPVVEAAFTARSVLTYPLLTIAELGPVGGADDIAYVVENAAVFVGLVRVVGGQGPLPTIVCTSVNRHWLRNGSWPRWSPTAQPFGTAATSIPPACRC